VSLEGAKDDHRQEKKGADHEERLQSTIETAGLGLRHEL
jgi:hypothetical protein